MKAKRRTEILSQVDPKCRLVAGSVALTEPAASHASQVPQELSRFLRGLVSLWFRLRWFAERSRRAGHLPAARLRQQLLDPC